MFCGPPNGTGGALVLASPRGSRVRRSVAVWRVRACTVGLDMLRGSGARALRTRSIPTLDATDIRVSLASLALCRGSRRTREDYLYALQDTCERVLRQYTQPCWGNGMRNPLVSYLN